MLLKTYVVNVKCLWCVNPTSKISMNVTKKVYCRLKRIFQTRRNLFFMLNIGFYWIFVNTALYLCNRKIANKHHTKIHKRKTK